MKPIHKIAYTWLMTVFLTAVSSCTLTELDINEDPNNPADVSPNLLLTSVQLNAVSFLDGLNYDAHGFVGILSSNDSYNLNNNSYNGPWNYFYSSAAKDLDGLINTAEKSGNQPLYLGVGQVMKAYLFGMMVDLFGDIPYSEALDGDQAGENINPKFEDDQVIYEDLIKLCDAGLDNLSKTSATAIVGDLIYNGSVANWKTLANTVKLRLLINSRRARPTAAAEIQAIVAGGDYIKTASQDFQFRYNRIATPEGRHPWYQNAYAAAENTFTYFLHQYIYEMLRDDDPRTPFYFKRQSSTILNPDDPTDRSTIPCSQTQGCKYAYWVLNPFIWQTLYTDKGKTATKADSAYIAGFFGRDRGDISGVPQDVNARTAPGTYPAGGQYDVTRSSATGNVNTRGAGDGITPLITSWMVKFYLIEANLTLGTTLPAGQTPQSLFEAAMREQMKRVEEVGLRSDPSNAKAMDA
ncbi:MAG: SusD/RagB family nutrient-binding outer membrane lipoprotein, partial [Ferruginibacter sp.]|nr:SusD/RagB family nutrient-binding outer membrane lipoprotein [Cytophagales bacterium]